ncbi:hypothetical protein KIL84_008605 [Mauremys mutica]|uniref:Uncharacterized protein n=1 Tax=Mauremys mutica TaxID=74926 RepID=A0A9D4AYK8_9SAUR|nr:hypothetical protein KIL84_008605 [Mauremys mutica]
MAVQRWPLEKEAMGLLSLTLGYSVAVSLPPCREKANVSECSSQGRNRLQSVSAAQKQGPWPSTAPWRSVMDSRSQVLMISRRERHNETVSKDLGALGAELFGKSSPILTVTHTRFLGLALQQLPWVSLAQSRSGAVTPH